MYCVWHWWSSLISLRFDQITHTRDTMNSDGINSLTYRVINVDKLDLFTKITVDVGKPWWPPPPRVSWQEVAGLAKCAFNAWTFRFLGRHVRQLNIVLLVLHRLTLTRTSVWMDTCCQMLLLTCCTCLLLWKSVTISIAGSHDFISECRNVWIWCACCREMWLVPLVRVWRGICHLWESDPVSSGVVYLLVVTRLYHILSRSSQKINNF